MTATVWNSADKSGSITLSSGDTVATCTSSTSQGVRATSSKDSSLGGKFVIGFRSVVLGISPDPFDWVGVWQITETLGVANGNLKQVILTQEGKTYSGDGGSTSDQHADFSSITGTHDWDLALDFDNMKFWFREDGGAWQNSGDPATNTNGRDIIAGAVFYPACRLTQNGSTATIQPVPTSLPSGFSPWDNTGDANATGSTITVSTSLILSDGFAQGALKTVTVSLITPNASASGSLITVNLSLVFSDIVLAVDFDDDALLETWSEMYNSQVVQSALIAIGR